MDQISINKPQDTYDRTSLEGAICDALNSLLSQFKDRKKGIRILAKKMGIHEKTLNRILNNENKPGYQTVFKIFRIFFNEYNDRKILELVPDVVRQYLIKNNAQELSEEKNYSTLADLELQKNPIASEIYIIAATGPVSYDDIAIRFGQYGLEILKKMLTSNLLQEVHKDIFVKGVNHPTFSGETIIAVGSTMIASHAKIASGEELDKNFISFYAEGLSEESYKEWLAIDQMAHQKKFELTRNPQNLGPVRAFTFMITEKIELNKLH